MTMTIHQSDCKARFIEEWGLADSKPSTIEFSGEDEDCVVTSLHYDHSLSEEEIESVAVMLEHYPLLTEITFSSAVLRDEGTVRLGKALQVNRTLESLAIDGDRIGKLGADMLGEAVGTHPAMRRLKLWHAQLGDEETVALLQKLGPHCLLEELDLQGNQIGDIGAAALGRMLAVNPMTRKLMLDRNDIGDKGITSIMAGLTQNHGLELLALEQNSFSILGTESLPAIPRFHPGFSVLNLSGRMLGDAAGKQLAALLEANPGIHEVDISHSLIEDMSPFVELFRTPRQITHFYWEGSPDDTRHIDEISQAILESGSKNILKVEPSNSALRILCNRNIARAAALLMVLAGTSSAEGLPPITASDAEQEEILERWAAFKTFLTPVMTGRVVGSYAVTMQAHAQAGTLPEQLLKDGKPTATLKMLCQLGMLPLLGDLTLWEGHEKQGWRNWQAMWQALPPFCRQIMAQVDTTALSRLGGAEPSSVAFQVKAKAPRLEGRAR